jgi:hypothetical protein
MTEAFRILSKFGNKVCQLHISELDSTGHHFPLSFGSMQAFSEMAYLIPADAPAILESLNPLQGAEDELQRVWIEREANRASAALGRGEMLRETPISSIQIPLSSDSVPA